MSTCTKSRRLYFLSKKGFYILKKSDNCILVFIFYQNHISLCTIPDFCILFEKKNQPKFHFNAFQNKTKGQYFLCLYNEILLTTKHEEIKFVSALNIC